MKNEILNKIEKVETFTFDAFFENLNRKVLGSQRHESDTSFENLKLNYYRMSRILQKYKPGEKVSGKLSRLSDNFRWFVITEDWCGDSAQILPYLFKLSLCNKNINLKILLRDSNPDIMDAFLTRGTRSIPVLLVFNSSEELTVKWGPRPEAAINLVNELKAKGLEKKEFIEKLHLWYNSDQGKELEKEIEKLF